MSRLAKELSRMLGEDTGIGVSEITDSAGLFPPEALHVARAISSRQAEFAAGRRAARAALAGIGRPPCALPVGKRRAPVWPDGVVGSITHDAGLALAVALPSDSATSVGIDLTEAAPLPRETRREILPFDVEASLSDIEARVGFSAKESLLKALFPPVGDYFGFDAAIVETDIERGTFDIRLNRAIGLFAKDQAWRGCVLVEGGRILTALRLPVASA